MIYLVEIYRLKIDGTKELDLIKVGYSQHPQKRLLQIQRFKGECKLRLTVPGTVEREQVILSRLRVRHRQPGNTVSEYFYPTALEDAIKEIESFKSSR